MTLADVFHWYETTCFVCAPFVIWAARFHELCREYWRKKSRASDAAKLVAILGIALVYMAIGPVWVMIGFLRESRDDRFSQ